jgi:hypothetical protein
MTTRLRSIAASCPVCQATSPAASPARSQWTVCPPARECPSASWCVPSGVDVAAAPHRSGDPARAVRTNRTCGQASPGRCSGAAYRARSGGSVVSRQRRRRTPLAACQDPTSTEGRTSRAADQAEREAAEDPPGSQAVGDLRPCSIPPANARREAFVAARARGCPSRDPARVDGPWRDRRPARTPGLRRRAVPLIPRPGSTWVHRHVRSGASTRDLWLRRA